MFSGGSTRERRPPTSSSLTTPLNLEKINHGATAFPMTGVKNGEYLGLDLRSGDNSLRRSRFNFSEEELENI